MSNLVPSLWHQSVGHPVMALNAAMPFVLHPATENAFPIRYVDMPTNSQGIIVSAITAAYALSPTVFVGIAGSTASYFSVNRMQNSIQRLSPGFGCIITTSPQKWSVTAPTKVALPTWSVHSFAEDYADARKPDWDCAGAEAITDDVVHRAQTFLSQFPALPSPAEVSPLSDGALSFVWDLPAGYLFLSVGPGNVLHVFYDVAKLGKWERITSLDSRDAQERLRSVVRELTHKEQDSSTTTMNVQEPEPESHTELLAA